MTVTANVPSEHGHQRGGWEEVDADEPAERTCHCSLRKHASTVYQFQSMEICPERLQRQPGQGKEKEQYLAGVLLRGHAAHVHFCVKGRGGQVGEGAEEKEGALCW
jgi:hypothetical protein